jgi:hypothetical protein
VSGVQGRLLSLSTNIRLGRNGLPGTNTVAHLLTHKLLKFPLKSFKTLAGGNLVFYLVLEGDQNLSKNESSLSYTILSLPQIYLN